MRYLAPGMLDMRTIVDGLERLSDVEWQRKAWFSSGEYPVDSFEESLCSVFDDAGLSEYLRPGVQPKEFDEMVWSAIDELDVAVDEVIEYRTLEELMADPGMAKLREVAARVLALLKERGLTKDMPVYPPNPQVTHRNAPRVRREKEGVTFQLLETESFVRGVEWLSRLEGPRPSWMQSEAPAVPPIVEAEWFAFTVSSLNAHLSENVRPKQFDGRTWAAAKELDAALYEVDYGMGAEEHLRDPKVAKARALAAGLLAVLEARGLTEGVSGESEELEGRGWTQAILGNPSVSEK